MEFSEIYHFLFETYAGVLILVAVSILSCILLAAILEFQTKKTYVDRGAKKKQKKNKKKKSSEN